MRGVFKVIIVVSVFLGLAAGVFWLVTRPRKPTEAETAAPAEPSVNVVVMAVEAVTLPDAILLPASVEPMKSVKVPVEVAGVIEWLGVEEGSAVREGQEIARIDRRTLEAELDRARASCDLAKNDFERNERLFKDNIVTKEQFEQLKSQLAVAQAALQLVQLAFEKATILSPLGGILNSRPVEKGEYVKSGDVIAEVVQVDRVKVVVDVPEKDIKYVSLGTMLGVVLDGGAEKALPARTLGADIAEAIRQAVADRKITLGTVTYRSVVADEKTRTYRVEVVVPNPDAKLLPGMIVRTVVLRRMIPDAIAVPLFAVVPRDGRAVVYVENKGRAQEKTVGLGVTDGVNIQITQGLAAGDRLIVQGQRQLRDGTLLNIVTGGSASGETAKAPGTEGAQE